MTSSLVQIKQLAHRLESTSSAERIEALGELQSLARSDPATVGEAALLKAFKILREHSNPEEYAEALDLTSRLISCSDKAAARGNSSIILSDARNVELLLELLEHEDMTVGVMTSQILTELHVADGNLLEVRIQDCPDGMIKLLQRLPDNSREEVRNQAIVLVQQLTSKNEELKKTVVFNEGFEILFRIISEEGGSDDAGLVVCDCLRICSNLLSGSETCQRLFFAMGSSWILTLAGFFNPSTLENPDKVKSMLVDAEHAQENVGWFDEPNRLSCAILALTAIAHALRPINPKHQGLILDNASVVITYSAFWIARGGPSELVSAALSVLTSVACQNVAAAAHIATSLFVKVPPASTGRSIPPGIESASLTFGWRPLPQDDCRFISVLSLLAERFVYPTIPWDPPAGKCFDFDLQLFIEVQSNMSRTGVEFAQGCLRVFADILSADSRVSDIMIQFVLAPPPPPMSDDVDDMHSMQGGAQRQLDTMRPLCAILVGMVVQTCEKTLSATHVYGGVASTNLKPELDLGERSLSLLSLVFLNGSLVAKELMTAISSVHVQQANGIQEKNRIGLNSHSDHKPIVSNMIASVGKAARLPGGIGYPFLGSLLQLLAIVVSGCERAACQMFEDPANLFVVDLASSSSEVAGVPSTVQFAVCFFLGCCFLALPKERKEGEGESSILQRRNFLSMLESKLSLNRFNDTLRRPIVMAKKQHSEIELLPPFAHVFALPGFKDFYVTQVEAIKTAIFELYSGVDTAEGMDSVHQQVILMQQEKIKELEGKLAAGEGGASGGEVARLEALVQEKDQQLAERIKHEQLLEEQARNAVHDAESAREEVTNVERTLSSVRNDLLEKDRILREAERSTESLQAEVHKLRAARSADEESVRNLQAQLQQARTQSSEWEAKLLDANVELSKLQALQKTLQANQDEIVRLKERILGEAGEKQALQETLERNERKLHLLESELVSLRNAHERDSQEQQLQKELASKESQLRELREALAAKTAVRGIEADEGLSSAVEEVLGVLSTNDTELLAAELDLLRNPIDATPEELVGAVAAFLGLCCSTIGSAAGECSDIAEAAGLHSLEGPEGSLERVRSCFHKLRERMFEMEEVIDGSDVLQARLEALEDALQVSAQERAVLEEQAVKLNLSLEESQEALRAAQSRVAESMERASEERADETDEHVRVLRSEWLELLQSREKADEELQVVRGALSAAQSAAQEADSRVQSLEEQVLAKDMERANKSAELETLSSQEESRREELREAYSKLRAVKDALQELQQSSSAEIQSLRLQIEHGVHDQDHATQATAKELWMARDELTASKHQLHELEGKVKDWEKKSLHLEEALQTAQQQARDYQLEGDQLRAQVHNLTDELATVQEELALSVVQARRAEEEHQQARSEWEGELAQTLQSMRDAETERNELSQECAGLREETRLLRQQLLELEESLAISAEAVNRAESLLANVEQDSAVQREGRAQDEQRVQALQQTIASLETAVAEHSQTEAQLAQEKLAWQQEKAAWQSEQDRLSTLHAQQCQELRDQLLIAQTTASALSEEKQSLQSQALVAHEQLASSERQLQELDALRQTYQSLEETHQALVRTHAVLADEVTVLQQELADQRGQTERIAREANEKQSFLDSLSAKLKVLEAEAGRLRAEGGSQARPLPTTASTGASATAAEAQIHGFQQRVRILEEMVEEKNRDLAENDQQMRRRQKEMDQLKTIINRQVEEIRGLKDQRETNRASSAPRFASPSRVMDRLGESNTSHSTSGLGMHTTGMNSFVVQENELKRLSQTADRMAKEAAQKELELQETLALLKRKEGELAGLKMTYESIKVEVRELRAENDRLTEEHMVDQQALRSLQGQVESMKAYLATLEGKGQGAGIHARGLAGLLPTTSAAVGEAASGNDRVNQQAVRELQRIVQNLQVKYGSAVRGKGIFVEGDSMDLNRVVSHLQTSVSEVLSKLQEDIRTKDRELTQLRGGSAYSTLTRASGLPTTPYRGGSSSSPLRVHPGLASMANGMSSSNTIAGAGGASAGLSGYGGGDGNADLVTPTKRADSVAEDWGVAARLSASKFSPSAALRLKEELVKEKKKLHSMEEEHTELLGLLAQQEVQLSTYRSALKDKVGDQEARGVEREAREHVTKAYGTYSSYRNL